MPSPFATLLHPTRTSPPPVAIDLGRVMLAGTGVWVLALLVGAVLALNGEIEWDGVWVCATGAALGLVGVDWARRHRPDEAGAAADSAAPAVPASSTVPDEAPTA